MADQRKRLSELPSSSNTDGLYTLGVDVNNEGVKIPIGDLLDDAKAPGAAAVATANEAKTTANQASVKADNAQTRANTAVLNAQQATLAAQAAANQASLANTTANTAKDTADEAKTAADNAAQSASDATDIANAATGTANKAQSDADAANTLAQSAVDATDVINARIAPRVFVNAQELLGLSGENTLESVIALLNAHDDVALYKVNGVVITFIGENGWETWQYVWYLRQGHARPTRDMFVSASSWKKFGGSASVGNCYNVTNDAPLAMGYYTLDTAIAKAYEQGFVSVGIQITFAIADKSWKTYQYIGADTEATTFKNANNWLDLAGMSAGAETLINIDALCGPCSASQYYTLEYAIAAIVALSNASGIDYRKPGLVITFQSAENAWQTYQFTSSVGNFGEAGLWNPFGSGGSDIETSDTPEADGAYAFSTGGAYQHTPTDISVDTETEGIVKLALMNADGQQIGNQAQFAVGTGTGTAGLVMEITPEASPLYGQAGGNIVLKCAITLKNGSDYESGIIERAELIDRDTMQTLETFKLNKATSADKATFDFSFDISRYFSLASQRKFKLVAYDDSERTASRNINVTAVDVTIKSEQTLNYTQSTAINVGGAVKTLPMYRFANNASDKGILCTTEIMIGGVWKTLGTAVVSDTYAHSITIDPKNCCGSVLSHGAYPMRIHGEDISSGVLGNYLHTAVMVVDTSDNTPIVVSRWYTEKAEDEVKQYESISMDFAAYSPVSNSVSVEIIESVGGASHIKRTTMAARNTTYAYTQRIQGYVTDGSVVVSLTAKSASVQTLAAEYRVRGSLLNIESVSAQMMLDMDFSGRSNADSDKSITDGGYTLSVSGANYTTNGFVKDTFGTSEYGQPGDTGIMALRIAENVKAVLDYQPFNVASIDTNGLALQFRIRTKHIADDDARLISCISNGLGFYATGGRVVFTTDNEAQVAHTINAALKEGSITDVCIVIEPTSQAPYAGIGVVKMYFDGELIGTCYYESGSLSRHNMPISFDGTHGDLYLYNIKVWETYFGFEQSFDNYLLRLADTDAMITEYAFNQVMASQSAEGRPARNMPQMGALAEKNMPYLVMCKSKDTEDVADNYPEYLEGLDGDKKTSRLLDWYFYFPDKPWRNIVIESAPTTNQGTTSSWRPVKNKKCKLKSAKGVRLMYERSQFTDAAQLAEYDFLAGLAAKKKFQLADGTLPTNIFTVKVDYSESGGANNGASTTLYNELTRAMGADYMTPAQNAYSGEYTLNPCISSMPVALYRTDANSPDATSPSYGYFHAKANLNHDKGDAALFGFEKCDGYNAGCLNYGDFYELIAARGQSLDAFLASQDQSAWEFAKDAKDASKGNFDIVVLSEFCGPAHRVFRRNGGTWSETTGTMAYSGGRWRITGDVVNPVENYELKAYNDMDWFQNVSTIDDMLRRDDKGNLVWLQQYESRYPDDDALNAAYEDGRKLPYHLFAWLQWCNECNQHKTEADGDIQLDGANVSGTTQNRLKKFEHELHNVANVHSMLCYHVFTDYIAAVDQRSKNMMLGFYLEADGKVRAYLNHLYDGDTILGSDNDCGLTIPALLDPNNDPNGYYQGHDSVLFTQLANASHIWIADYASESDTSDTTKTVTVQSVAAAMRAKALDSGLRPFSPQGLEKYWVTDRLSKWPKLVSSFDGVRKYIENSSASSNYFFALHGLSIQRLQDFIKTRFRYRDGFYECGDTYSSAAQMRCTGTNMSIRITAAKDGFFGLGVDRANEANGGSVYLHEGESATLYSKNTNLGSGVMLYIFGADRIAELDLTSATPKTQGWDISALTLLRKLIIGGANYTPATSTGDELSTLKLGEMPFLEEIDARNSSIVSIDAASCPRLKRVLAEGSSLRTFTPAQTAPIDTLHLPDRMTSLNFVNLPQLTYPNGGLTIEGFANVSRLQLAGCPNIDAFTMLSDVVNGGATLVDINMSGLNVSADDTMLTKMMNDGTRGIGSDLQNACDGISGKWILSHLIDDDALATLQTYYPELTLHNAQFTGIVFDDTMSDPKNITNLDNGTTGDAYAPSGHILRIRQALIPVFGKLDKNSGKWVGSPISNTNYRQLPDGSDFDYQDTIGTGNDTMMRMPPLWYKGVNDFKNQKKYVFWSSLADEPLSTASNIRRAKLADIIVHSSKSVHTTDVVVGADTIDKEGVLTDTADFNVHRFDVSDMKQVRWPGFNSSVIGAVFTDADGVIVGTFNLAIAHQHFDFIDGDYVFCDVPERAKHIYFASKSVNAQLEAIAVDSSQIEAIEPDWVHSDAWLCGVYEASVDALMQLRSLSNVNVKVGNNVNTTSTEWTYDDNGRATNTPVNAMNYTMKDFQNLAMRRGTGYQLIDYEMSKLAAMLWFSMSGTRDASLTLGYGRGSGGVTGYFDTLGNADSVRINSNNGNKCLGFESFFACTYEWMDNVAVNTDSYASFMRNHGVAISTEPLDAVWHIYDPVSGTEREVQGIKNSGYCIARTRHGRYCDVIASACSTDNSRWAEHYCDCNYYTNDRCRVVGRAYSYANASGGLVYAYAVYASSQSYTGFGSRLAFRGRIEIAESD